MTTDNSVQATAEALTTALKTLSARLDTANRRARMHGRLIAITIVSVILDVILTVVVVFFGIQLHHTAASNTNLCLASNASRAEQIQLWDYVLGISKEPATKAERERVAAFEIRLHTLFAPRNCANVDPNKP